jgi:hypothetical protein
MTTRGKQPTPTDLAYIAGFVDGEGTIGIYRKYDLRKEWAPGYAERIIIVQVDQTPLKFIQEFFPKSSLSAKKQYFDNHQQSYCLKYSHTQAYTLVKAILPYLKVKRAQAQVLVEFREDIVHPDKKVSKKLPLEELNRREKLYQQMKELNGVQPQRLNRETP